MEYTIIDSNEKTRLGLDLAIRMNRFINATALQDMLRRRRIEENATWDQSPMCFVCRSVLFMPAISTSSSRSTHTCSIFHVSEC